MRKKTAISIPILWGVIRRGAEVIGATAVIYGAAVAIIVGFGGHVPPWTSLAEAQELNDKIEKFEHDQIAQNAQIQSNLDLLTLGNLMDQARLAAAKAKANPTDADAQFDARLKQQQLDMFFKTHPVLAAQVGTR